MSIRVLYVEDDLLSSRLIRKMLQPMGYVTIEAANATLGIQTALREKPDLILMDYNLPDMNGVEATRYLKNEAGLSSIPVILLTADVTEKVRLECLDAGCSGYLNKPISKAYLLRMLRQIVCPV